MSERDDAIAKLKIVCHRLKGALDRFYSHEVYDDPVAVEAEALDISVPIRVMVHHTRVSASLLSQLDASYAQKLIYFRTWTASPPQTLPSGLRSMSVSIPVNITLTTGAGVRPSSRFMRFERDAAHRVPLSQWWENPVWDSGTNKISNRDLVLSFANKEGGAHVDANVGANYAAARNQGTLTVRGFKVTAVARLGSLVGIAGDELLEYMREHYPEV